MLIEMSAKGAELNNGEDQNVKLSVEVPDHCSRDEIVNVFVAFLKATKYYTQDIEEDL